MEEEAKENEELTKQLVEKDKELEEQKNRFLRCLADFENFKKRSAAEKEDFSRFANELLILELLPVLDNFDRAIEHVEKSGGGEELIKGMALVRKQLEDVLTKSGVQEIDALGKIYDPHYHEAFLRKEDKNKDEGTILEVAQKGFTLNGKVIRPTMVIVSKK